MAVTPTGEALGTALYRHTLWSHHPRRFEVTVRVLPAAQRNGIGKALYAHLEREVSAHEPVALLAFAREDWARAIRFAEDRGFVEKNRDWGSELDLSSLDTSRLPDLEARLSAEGYRIVTLTAYPGSVEACDRELYDLDQVLGPDIPSTFPGNPIGYEDWRRSILDIPGFMREAVMLAVHDGAIMGLSYVTHRAADPECAHTGFTGVRREHRGKGLATALKLRSLAWAREQGYRRVWTMNNRINVPMLAINRRLGFVPEPVWIEFHKTFPANGNGQ